MNYKSQLKSVDNWYFPYWDKFELYSTLEWAVGKEAFSHMKESDIRDSCMFMTSVGKSPVSWYAYGKKITDFNAHYNPVRPGIIDWTLEGG
jgi:hypothetical protein